MWLERASIILISSAMKQEEQTIKALTSTLGRALREENTQLLSRCVDLFRFNHRLDYEAIYALARAETGISLGDWDQRLYDVDLSLDLER